MLRLKYKIFFVFLVLFWSSCGAQLLDDGPEEDSLESSLGENLNGTEEFIEDYIDDDVDLDPGLRGKGVKKLWHKLFELIVEKLEDLIGQIKKGKKVVRIDNHSGLQFRVRCHSNKAERHDVGPKDVADQHGFAFSFRSNIIRKKIIFRCDLNFKNGFKASFDAYGGSAPRQSNSFEVKPDGVYLGDRIILKI